MNMLPRSVRYTRVALACVSLAAGVPVAAESLSHQEAIQMATRVRDYAYPASKWGAWLKANHRMLARQCVQLGVPGASSPGEGEQAEETASPEETFAQGLATNPMQVPEGYKTPESLVRACRAMAAAPLRPYCWPRLQGNAAPYTPIVECALTTAGTAQTGIQLWAVQAAPRGENWIRQVEPSPQNPTESVRIRLAVPQLPGSETVAIPAPPPARRAVRAAPPPLPDIVVPGVPGSAPFTLAQPEGTVSRPPAVTAARSQEPTGPSDSGGALTPAVPTSPLARPEATPLKLPTLDTTKTKWAE